MGRGRRPISNFNGSDWETVFYNSVGTYVQFINIQLSKEYILEPLSNHLKIVGGYAFKTAEYKNQGVPIIRISDFNNEQIVLKDVVYYQESKELDKYQLTEGDIIIALTGGTIAKLAIVQKGLGKIYLNQRVGKFQALKPEEFEVEYIYWLARSIQSIIKNLAWGAAIPNVSPKQIEELKFPIPKKEVQRGIIDFLNDLKNNNLTENKVYFDENIENEIIALQEKQLTTSSISTELTNQLTLVKKLRQQLLQDAVQGKLVEQNNKDEPAIELLKKIKAEKQKLIAEKKLKKEKKLPPIKPSDIPFEIPENWVWCRLGEICTKVTDGFHNTPKKLGEGKIYISATHIREDGIKWSDCLYVSEKDHKELFNKAYPQRGEILITNRGAGCSTPVIIDIDEEFSFQNAALIGFNQQLVSNKYLFYFILKSRDEIMKTFVNGGLQPMLSNVVLGTIPIPLPPLAEQIRIVQKVEELMQYCNELETSIKQSESQNEKLLQQVLREALRKEPVEA
jgi:type I restriction enzyme S subunit